MKIKALEASSYKSPLIDNDVREALLLSGVVPVNDVFMPAWDAQDPIILLFGSYGSGKSIFVVDKLIRKAIENPYFRCYFGRKVFDTVRGSVFKTVIDRLKETRKDHLFHFSDAPNGSMQIRCKDNGNEFIPFGANDAKSLKSIKDPTDIFCEEFDQFTFEDFGLIFSRLRTEKAKTQFYGCFNTDKIFQSHFIRKVFFEGEYKHLALKLKANYYDNHFIDQGAYYDKLKLIANGNIAVLNAIAEGEWGMVRTGNEFWKQFDETKHVKQVSVNKGTTIHISLDENVNPYVTQTFWQIFPAIKHLNQVHEILSRSPDNNAPKAARQTIKWLRSIDYKDVVFVYGDPSAGRRSTVDENNSSFYDKYIEELMKAGFKIQKRVGKSAPEVALSGAFINEIYESNLYGWTITISDRCFTSIEDYITVKEDAEGKMLKEKTKDPESGITYEPKGHCSDTKRYIIIELLKDLWIKYKQRTKPTPPPSGMFR